MTVTFVVVERPFVRDVCFAGNKNSPPPPCTEKIDLKLGTVYNPVEVQKARGEAQGVLTRTRATSRSQITPETREVPRRRRAVVFQIAEGRRSPSTGS